MRKVKLELVRIRQHVMENNLHLLVVCYGLVESNLLFWFCMNHDHSNRLLDLFSLLGFLVKPTSQLRTRTIRCDGGHYGSQHCLRAILMVILLSLLGLNFKVSID